MCFGRLSKHKLRYRHLKQQCVPSPLPAFKKHAVEKETPALMVASLIFMGKYHLHGSLEAVSKDHFIFCARLLK